MALKKAGLARRLLKTNHPEGQTGLEKGDGAILLEPCSRVDPGDWCWMDCLLPENPDHHAPGMVRGSINY